MKNICSCKVAQWPAEMKKILDEEERKMQIQSKDSAGNRLVGMMSGMYLGLRACPDSSRV